MKFLHGYRHLKKVFNMVLESVLKTLWQKSKNVEKKGKTGENI